MLLVLMHLRNSKNSYPFKRIKRQSLGRVQQLEVFGKSSSNKYVDIANLKKNAKGDNKIKLEDKIFIWCVYIKNPDDDSINIEKDKNLYL